MSITKKKTRIGLATVVAMTGVLIGQQAMGIFGGEVNDAGYLGPLDTDWFDPNEPCLDPDASVQSYEAASLRQYAINVSNIGKDGNNETFLKCELLANLDALTCLVGVGEENGEAVYVSCTDIEAPNVLPTDGDIVYMTFFTNDPATACEIVVATGDRYGVANPACYPADGEGGGTSNGGGSSTGGTTGGGLGCDANSVPPPIPVDMDEYENFVAGTCYSYEKAGYESEMRFWNWTGGSYGVEFEDSAMNSFSATAPNSAWLEVPGAVNGTIYFRMDSNVTAKVSDWKN